MDGSWIGVSICDACLEWADYNGMLVKSEDLKGKVDVQG
jgi:3-deoxy-D-arabino-heptulosonate 7-phosphate (DAHP) synthase